MLIKCVISFIIFELDDVYRKFVLFTLLCYVFEIILFMRCLYLTAKLILLAYSS